MRIRGTGSIREIVLGTPARGDWHVLGSPAGRDSGGVVPGVSHPEPPPLGQRLSFQATGAGSQDVPGARAEMHSGVLTGDLAAAHKRMLATGAAFASEHTSPNSDPGGQQAPGRACQDPAGPYILPCHPVITHAVGGMSGRYYAAGGGFSVRSTQ